MSVNLSRGDYDDEVLAEGYKHRVVSRAGQILVMVKGERWPVQYGDYGSTRSSREDALRHFRALEEPYYQGE